MGITRRGFIRAGSGLIVSASVLSDIPRQALARADSVSSVPLATRTVAIGNATSVGPLLRFVTGLAGFAGLITQAGGDPGSLVWTGDPADASETLLLVIGFSPTKTALQNGLVSVAGVPAPTSLQLIAVPTSAFYPYPLVDDPVIETHFTPTGIPYDVVQVYPRSEPVITTTFQLVDATSGQIHSQSSLTYPSQTIAGDALAVAPVLPVVTLT